MHVDLPYFFRFLSIIDFNPTGGFSQQAKLGTRAKLETSNNHTGTSVELLDIFALPKHIGGVSESNPNAAFGSPIDRAEIEVFYDFWCV